MSPSYLGMFDELFDHVMALNFNARMFSRQGSRPGACIGLCYIQFWVVVVSVADFRRVLAA